MSAVTKAPGTYVPHSQCESAQAAVSLPMRHASTRRSYRQRASRVQRTALATVVSTARSSANSARLAKWAQPVCGLLATHSPCCAFLVKPASTERTRSAPRHAPIVPRASILWLSPERAVYAQSGRCQTSGKVREAVVASALPVLLAQNHLPIAARASHALATNSPSQASALFVLERPVPTERSARSAL